MPLLGSVNTHYKTQEELQKAGQQDLVGFIIMRMRDLGREVTTAAPDYRCNLVGTGGLINLCVWITQECLSALLPLLVL